MYKKIVDSVRLQIPYDLRASNKDTKLSYTNFFTVQITVKEALSLAGDMIVTIGFYDDDQISDEIELSALERFVDAMKMIRYLGAPEISILAGKIIWSYQDSVYVQVFHIKMETYILEYLVKSAHTASQHIFDKVESHMYEYGLGI